MRRNTFKKSRSPSKRDGLNKIDLQRNPCYSSDDLDCKKLLKSIDIDTRVDNIFQRMSLDQKIAISIKSLRDAGKEITFDAVKLNLDQFDKISVNLVNKLITKIVNLVAESEYPSDEMKKSVIDTVLSQDPNVIAKQIRECDLSDLNDTTLNEIEIDFPTYLYDDSKDKEEYIKNQIEKLKDKDVCDSPTETDVNRLNIRMFKKLFKSLDESTLLDKVDVNDKNGKLINNTSLQTKLKNHAGINNINYIKGFIDFYNSKLDIQSMFNEIFKYFDTLDTTYFDSLRNLDEDNLDNFENFTVYSLASVNGTLDTLFYLWDQEIKNGTLDIQKELGISKEAFKYYDDNLKILITPGQETLYSELKNLINEKDKAASKIGAVMRGTVTRKKKPLIAAATKAKALIKSGGAGGGSGALTPPVPAKTKKEQLDELVIEQFNAFCNGITNRKTDKSGNRIYDEDTCNKIKAKLNSNVNLEKLIENLELRESTITGDDNKDKNAIFNKISDEIRKEDGDVYEYLLDLSK